ncbi:translation initiation factor [Lithospermum erythrorhizon]|uniref:Translation initiation factor n=1 Tax=Lithospermum erythrorhizon TaxID=34254 RepID=A0AAV3PPZ3_LITER
MGGGRKNLKRAVEEGSLELENGQTIMQVMDLRGSNSIEVMDAKGEKSLAIFPARFQKSMWIKRGNFVVVDESGREESVENGRKVGCMVTQVLYHAQLQALQKSSDWPEVFRSKNLVTSNADSAQTSLAEESENSSDDDGLPPLEANLNRVRPFELQSDTDTDSDT